MSEGNNFCFNVLWKSSTSAFREHITCVGQKRENRRRQSKLSQLGLRPRDKKRRRQALSLLSVTSTTIVPDLQTGALVKFEALSGIT